MHGCCRVSTCPGLAARTARQMANAPADQLNDALRSVRGSGFNFNLLPGIAIIYVKTALLTGTAEASRPQALVYEVDGDRLQLVAVEYIIPLSMWDSATPPTLFGRSFTRNNTLGLWALHAWIWRPNPLGIFANYNPSVKLCPGH